MSAEWSAMSPELLEDYLKLQHAAKNMYNRLVQIHRHEQESESKDCLDCHLMKELRAALIG